ncbi:MAG TPA: FAD-binding oxidoreductase, partial [Gammaproteobacteria bacterium]|nr:FAD-binding oxidoreductase [Gammaproteobacteria bacterium]
MTGLKQHSPAMQLANNPISSAVSRFLQQLRQSGFKGDIEESYGARITAATDNSVYQVLPQAILYPREGEDINRVVQSLLKQPESDLSVVARGGGTGTNGQSLNTSLVLDTSRYLNQILSIDTAARKVTVEPGVILDQLNDELARHGLFFPPDVSSGSRATIGGMVATDASGKGSRIYGKTSDWIDSMEAVLPDGSDLHVDPQTVDATLHPQSPVTAGEQLCQKVCALVNDHKESIDRTFPAINRGLTGYNLKQLISDDGLFQLGYLLAGSEGTLALTKAVTLRVIPRPRLKALMVVIYDSFDHTLAHIPLLLQAEPVAIEVLDDHILKTAQQDMVWQDVEASFSTFDLQSPIQGLSFIEIHAESDAELKRRCASMEEIITATGRDHGVMGMRLETGPSAISGLWAIRRRAVGLLGATRLGRERRPIAFVEDTAVPPDQLPAYIRAFRQLLQSHGLQYGMYGHADVGCLHVRPALDMRQSTDQQLLRTISDEVAALVQRFGGVFWGEHGRGFRGEYAPLFFGPELHPLLGEIKAIFDPHNRFNPGKLAAPATLEGARIKRIDELPFRGSFDARINSADTKAYHAALACN